MPARFQTLAMRLLARCLMLVFPVLCQAGPEPRYTYGEIGYVNADFDDVDADGDGLLVAGSYALQERVHLVAGYEKVDLNHGADFDQWNVGVGVNFQLRPGMDAVGRIRYLSAQLDSGSGSGSDDDDGYALEGLIRTMINSELELNAGVRYVDIYDDQTSLVVGAVYEIAKNFAITGEYDFGNDVSTIFIGGRLYFKPPRQMR